MDKLKKDIKAFYRRLRVYRRRRVLGLLLIEFGRTFGMAIVLLALYCLADFFLAFSNDVRIVIDVVLLVLLSTFFIVRSIIVLAVSMREIASILDKSSSEKRHRLLSALELTRESRGMLNKDDMRCYLISRLLKQAFEELGTVRFGNYFPLTDLGKRFRVLSVQIILVLLVLGTTFQASYVILQRIFLPKADIPPYSRYQFKINPELPMAVYGGNLELSAEITGGAVQSQVWFVTRWNGKTRKMACFREDGALFTQKVEKVTVPLEFCFSLGKARSEWRKIELLLQPEIAVARIAVSPPAYSRLPEKEFFAGVEGIQALRYSKLNMKISSNRPLSKGSLTIKYLDDDSSDIVIGEKVGPYSLSFDWTMTKAAELRIEIYDLRGTKSRKPLKLSQRLLKDQAPEIQISQPPSFILATDTSKVEVDAEIVDDLGLRRVDLVRTVVGYRDRSKSLGPKVFRKNLMIRNVLDLKKLGATPGQTLELYFEAADFNPNLMGISASELLRIKIISEPEYAQLLRQKTRIEDFFNRFQALQNSFNQLRSALEKALEKVNENKMSEEEERKTLSELENLNNQAKELFRKLAEDFPIYDAEKRHQEVYKEIFDKIFKNQELLLKSKAGSPDLKAKLEQMLKNLKQPESKFQQVAQEMREFGLIGEIMTQSARFSALMKEQEAIVRRLRRFNDPSKRYHESALFSNLSKREKIIRQELLDLVKTLREKAPLLPKEYKELRDSSITFANDISDFNIPGLLGQASESSGQNNGAKAYNYAKLALEKMERLVSKSGKGGFGGMMKCKLRFQVTKGLRKTMEQMLESIMNQMKNGKGGAGIGQTGMAGGGDAGDGYSMSGHSPLNIPVMGPPRNQLSQPNQSGSRSDNSLKKGSGGARGRIGKDRQNRMSISEKQKTATRQFPWEKVPKKYREAVKRYFQRSNK